MAFASAVGLGIRNGGLRVSTKSSTMAPWRLCRSNTRLFSSVLKPSCTSQRLAFMQAPKGCRNLSLWPSSKPAGAAAPPPVAEAPNVEEAAAANAAADLPAPNTVDVIPNTTIDTATATDPSTLVDTLSSTSISDTLLNTSIPALQYGDFAALGLSGWSPAGLVRWSFEIINVSTGLPWFWTIIAGSAFWRLVCVPLTVKGLQSSARLQPFQHELVALQNGVKRAQASGSPVEMSKATMAMKAFYAEKGINPLGGLVALLQLPITLGLFFAVQKMCKLPLEQLHESGFAWLPDLTAADPTMVLPVLFCAAVNAQVMIGVKDVNTTERPVMGHFMNVMRIMTIPGLYVMSAFPSGLLVSLMTTAILTSVQTLVLRIPAVRRSLGVPITPPEARGQLPSIMSTLRAGRDFLTDDVKSKVDVARRKEAERLRSRR